MNDQLLDMIGKVWPLTPQDDGNPRTAKVNGMKFEAFGYEAKGLGHVSLLQGKALFGLMRMDSLIVNAFDREMPLFSYDRMHMFGKDILYIEQYETRITPQARDKDFDRLLGRISAVPEGEKSSAWYDDICLDFIVRKGNDKVGTLLDDYASAYLQLWLEKSQNAPVCDHEAKRKAASVYTEGLLTHGGVSTDPFIKAIGRDATAVLYRECLFGTGKPSD